MVIAGLGAATRSRPGRQQMPNRGGVTFSLGTRLLGATASPRAALDRTPCDPLTGGQAADRNPRVP